MQRKTQRRRRFSPPKPLLVAALVVFLLVDVALVGYAFTRDGGSTSAARPAVTLTPSSSSTPTPTRSTPIETAQIGSPTTYLSAVDSSTAYRVAAGSCPSGAPVQLEKTLDAGATWAATPIATGVTSVLRLQATESAVAFVVGRSGQECATDFTATYTSGADFRSYPERLPAAWYLEPDADLPIHSPSGAFAAPCQDPVSLASTTEQEAAVLCSDGMIFQTLDAAASWDSGTQIEGVRALAVGAEGFLVASVSENSADCDGIEVSLLGADGVVSALGCRAGILPTGGLTVSEADGALWLMDDVTVSISTDAGQTWS